MKTQYLKEEQLLDLLFLRLCWSGDRSFCFNNKQNHWWYNLIMNNKEIEELTEEDYTVVDESGINWEEL
jgi:hypothetical protein